MGRRTKRLRRSGTLPSRIFQYWLLSAGGTMPRPRPVRFAPAEGGAVGIGRPVGVASIAVAEDRLL